MKPTVAPFPAARLRRARQSAAIRGMVRENTLTPDDLIWPVFVRDGEGIEEPVSSMPGVVRRSVDKIALRLLSRRRRWVFRPSACFPIRIPRSRPGTAPRPGTPTTCQTAPSARSRPQRRISL